MSRVRTYALVSAVLTLAATLSVADWALATSTPPVVKRVSVGDAGQQANGRLASPPSISGTGAVVFGSFATNLVAGFDTSAERIYLWAAWTPTRIVPTGNGRSWNPLISWDGAAIAFNSWSTNLVSGTQTYEYPSVYVRDYRTNSTDRVNTAIGDAAANGDSSVTAISSGGRYVVFTSEASNLVSGDTNGVSDVFRKDRTTGATVRVSVGAGGSQLSGASYGGATSADGNLVAFTTSAGVELTYKQL